MNATAALLSLRTTTTSAGSRLISRVVPNYPGSRLSGRVPTILVRRNSNRHESLPYTRPVLAVSTRTRIVLALSGGGILAASSVSNRTIASCEPTSPDNQTNIPEDASFPERLLSEDHYKGVTIHLDKMTDHQEMTVQEFQSCLAQSLQQWEQQGRKGIWIHVPPGQADKIPIATSLGFDFHLIVAPENARKDGDGADPTHAGTPNVLVLTKWLPPNVPSRLPHGPTHQIGVGCLILHPLDETRMLVVQEKSGPAAAYGLWKMPTGLADPHEDLHDAAVRELHEETGLHASFQGVLVFRQAHASKKTATARLGRTVSDMFFVCRMALTHVVREEADWETTSSLFAACPDEIAAIQWMPIRDYCAQERWQSSPVYLELNKAILHTTKHNLFQANTLDLGFGAGTNTLYMNSL
jgi:8-oxo-dGTP pyrophosphatase MutT (NUDIX family)